MANKKIIAVLGATGAQGGGLVRAILEDKTGEFTARALTRDVNSNKAKELAQLGAEVVAANVDDVDSLKQAFSGAHGAYCVTFYWEHMSPEKEYAHAKAMAEAAKQAGLAHLIWSTFEDTRKWVPLTDNRMPTLMGKYKVPHFDAKAEANAVFIELGVPTTFLLTSFYWENFINFGMGPKKGPDGKLAITMPMGDKKLPGIASEGSGNSGGGVFNAKGEVVGMVQSIVQTETNQGERRCSRFAFAVPGHLVQRIVTALIDGSHPGFPRIGIGMTAAKIGNRWRVAVSKASGPAKRGGIRKGDILLSIDDRDTDGGCS